MNNLICAICGKDFLAKRSDTKYCSEKCKTRKETMQRVEKQRANRNPIIKKCAVCGDDFTAHIRNPHQIYCSEVCLRQAMQKRAVESGRKKEFYHKHKGQYSSIKRNTDNEYKDRIRFSGNKKHVLERDGHQCTICGKTTGLIVHHIDGSGSSEHPNNDMSNLTTLCRSCHMKEHSGENNARFINISKEQLLHARKQSSSWDEVAKRLGVDRTIIFKRKKMFGIF